MKQQEFAFDEAPAAPRLVATTPVSPTPKDNPAPATHLGVLAAVPDAPRPRAERPPRELWREDPWAAFEAWLEVRAKIDDRAYSERSNRQHRAMWNTYLTYLKGKAHPLVATPAHVAAFLDSLKTKHKRNAAQPPADALVTTKLRYLRLLTAVYNHMNRVGARRGDNPCPELFKTFTKTPEKLPAALYPQHHERFVQKVLATPATSWRDVRDQAMLVLIVGSGLYAQELLDLEVDQIDLDCEIPQIYVPGHGRVPERVAPVLEFAVGPLRRWLQLRASMNRTDKIVFFSGRRFSSGNKPTDGKMLAATLYRKVEKVLQDTEGPVVRARGGKGPQILRNSFLMRQFEKNKPVENVKEWAGHVLEKSTLRFQRLVPNKNGIRAE